MNLGLSELGGYSYSHLLEGAAALEYADEGDVGRRRLPVLQGGER